MNKGENLEAMRVEGFISLEGLGSVIVEGPTISAVISALISRRQEIQRLNAEVKRMIGENENWHKRVSELRIKLEMKRKRTYERT